MPFPSVFICLSPFSKSHLKCHRRRGLKFHRLFLQQMTWYLALKLLKSLKHEYHFQDRHQVNPVSTHPESNTMPPTCHVWRQIYVYWNEETGEVPSKYSDKKKKNSWTSLVAQWIRICLLMQGRWVWSLVWEDSTYGGESKPVCHN